MSMAPRSYTDMAKTTSSALRAGGVSPRYKNISSEQAFQDLYREQMNGQGAGLSRAALRKAFELRQGGDVDDDQFAQVWSLADANGDGLVDVNEFKDVYDRLSLDKVRAEVKGMMDDLMKGGVQFVDTSASGDLANMEPSRAYKELQNQYQFGPGGLDKKTLYKVVSVGENDLDNETFNRVWELADQDGNGTVSAKEFEQLFQVFKVQGQIAKRLREVQQENEQLKKDLGMSAEEEARRRAAMAAKKKALQEKKAARAKAAKAQ
jgi:Ca2+-binding EF-hand superfamily protein